MKATRLRVRALGACLITAGKLRIKPDSAVLFALALHVAVRAGDRVTRAEVLELLWPGDAPTARRHALRQLLYRLKQSGVPLDADGDELSLRPDEVECDLTALLRDDWPATVAIADIPSVSSVLPSYHPDVTDAFHAWVDDLRARCGAQIRTAALRHVASARREGRWADLERVARICIETDPLNEEATLALGESVAMSGSKAEALRLLDTYLWELGDRGKTIGLPARLLRRRISEQPVYRAPRAGDPPLIARADDIAWLNAKLDETSVGQCCTAMLVGPPGIGKTAVVQAFVSHAEMRGWRFIESRLQPSDVDRPMSVFVELFPALLKASGALGAAPESIAQLRRLVEFHVVDDILANKSQEAEAVQARIRESTLDLLDAVTHEGPLVLVLEDLHWVDRQSLRLLTWVLEHATKAPVLWLLTARMDGRFADLRDVLPADRVPSRTIEPLGRSSTMALFRACIPEAQRDTDQPVPEHAYDVTGGNPLFIREVAGHWAETGGTEALPGNLKALMRGRVARLPAAAQRVLHCCAVLGRFASVPRVSVVLEISTTELLACIEEVDGLGLVGLGGEPGSLSLHDLWQEELISTLRPASRALLHLRCGEVLASESSESKLASMVSEAARHLIAAGVRERALRLLEDAAEHQLANGLSEDAVGSLEQAIASCLGDEDRLRLEQHRIRALLTIGGWQKIAASVDAILVLHRKVDRLATEHSALELIAIESTMLAGMDLHETIARASRCAQSSNADDLHRATAARLGARAASNVADAESLAAFGSLASKLDRTKPAVLAQLLAVETVFHTDIGSIEHAIRVSSELVEIERSAGAIRGLIRALRYRAIPLRITSSFDEAIAVAGESFDLAVRHRIAEDAAAGADLLATILFEAGDLKSARIWLEHAEPWVKRVSASYARTSANATRAMIALEAGDVDEAAAHTPLDVEAISKDPVVRHRMFHLSIAARILLARKELISLGKCATELRQALEQARPFRRNEYFIASLALVALAIDSADAARRVVSDFSESRRNDRLVPWRELALFR